MVTRDTQCPYLFSITIDGQSMRCTEPNGHTGPHQATLLADPPMWEDQLRAVAPSLPLDAAITCMNQLVVAPCPLPPRIWGFLWRPPQHCFDNAYLVRTPSQYVHQPALRRCRRCGLVVGI